MYVIVKINFLKYFYLIVAFFCASPAVVANNDSLKIKVKVTDKDNPFVWVNYMAVNKAGGQGSFGNRDGVFFMKIHKNDTVIIQSKGYYEKRLCFRDSVWKKEWSLTVAMEKKPIELRTVEVKPDRTFKEIETDIKTLKKENPSDYENVNPAENVVTALYERFSKIGREKARVAELEYKDREKELLHELMSKYVDGGLISLEEKDFDSFIAYCRFNIDFIRSSTQYDLIVYVKDRYEDFKIATKRK